MIYQQSCSACHGNDLQGTSVGPNLMHGLYVPSHHNDQRMLRSILNGVAQHHWQFGDMPANDVTKIEAKALIQYIRKHQREQNVF